MMGPASPSFEQYAEIFASHDRSEQRYLRYHFPRYAATKRRLLSNWDRNQGDKLLDVGAHWLHQAVLYAIDGFEVTALDLPHTLETKQVRELAQEHAIELLPNSSLEYPAALREVPDNTFDLILFTEIIEHITFNPVAMWREIYRVMKPGARIALTTPNHYALRSSVRRWMRAVTGKGAGTPVHDILMLRTLGHHWKEFSMSELKEYFTTLSPDFRCMNSAYVTEFVVPPKRRLRGMIASLFERAIPFLRPGLYLEIELARKETGIVVEPHW